MMRSAHSCCTISGNFLYSRSSVRAAFFLTNAFDDLHGLVMGPLNPDIVLTVKLAIYVHLRSTPRPSLDLQHSQLHEAPGN